MPRAHEEFDVSSSPSRPRRQEPSWVMLWLTIFSSVVLANLVAAAILFLAARGYVNYKVEQFNQAMEEAVRKGKK